MKKQTNYKPETNGVQSLLRFELGVDRVAYLWCHSHCPAPAGRRPGPAPPPPSPAATSSFSLYQSLPCGPNDYKKILNHI